ncbi:trihelix transcription factor GT-3b-like [Rutidosis leptorrhynchoides]|uniref:trihelix transcription factor GT-3b-like n=1 Tax=Rutidosis leptorrhynchoides TaxID=125765 RepID=UPI003A99D31A
MYGVGSSSGSAGGAGDVGGMDNDETLARLNQIMMGVPVNFPSSVSVPVPPAQPVVGGGGGGDVDEYSRVPMWSHQETKDFIAIRGELESEFNVAKRNKGLWEVVAVKMKELGYRRTPDQCKCKWKNLFSRYKGKETSDRDNARSFPFFEELHAVFTQRATNTPQIPFDPETTSSQSKSKKRVTRIDSYQSFEEFTEDEDEYEVEETKTVIPPTKKPDRGKRPQISNPDKPPTPKSSNSESNVIREILHDFFQQQQSIDEQWRQLMEKHAYERQLFEQEWRQSMERIEMERMRNEQLWREKEEQRKIREESRAEKRDALLQLLLNKLVHEQ